MAEYHKGIIDPSLNRTFKAEDFTGTELGWEIAMKRHTFEPVDREGERMIKHESHTILYSGGSLAFGSELLTKLSEEVYQLMIQIDRECKKVNELNQGIQPGTKLN